MDIDYSGEKFLSKLYKELYLSFEDKSESEENDTKEEAYKKYLDRLEKVYSLTSTKNKMNFLKELYYKKYVIKKENIKGEYSKIEKKDIIEKQKKSLSLWIDYFTDENEKYPLWAKYWALQGMLKLGEYDEALGVYQRRSENTTSPFVAANAEIISNCINNMMRYMKSVESSNKENKPVVETGSFKKLYEYYEKKYKSSKNNKSINGKWVKYNKGNKEDAISLYHSLENKSTGWCIANEDMALNQVCGLNGYDASNFYVYYTFDENNEYTIPRIAIKTNENGNINQIIGVGKYQNVENSLLDILESKLRRMPFIVKDDIHNNVKTINDLRQLVQIYKKTTNNEELNEKEILSLYTKKFGFGWHNDLLAEELINKRNIDKDLSKLETPSKKGNVVENINNKDRFPFLKDSKYTIDNKLVALEVLKLDCNALSYMSKNMQNDKEVVLEAVKQNGSTLCFASEELMGDIEVVKEAINNNPYAIKYASEELKNNLDIALETIRNDPNVIDIVGRELYNNKKFMFEAVQINITSFKYASEELKYDKEFVLKSLKKYDIPYIIESLDNEKSIFVFINDLREQKNIGIKIKRVFNTKKESLKSKFKQNKPKRIEYKNINDEYMDNPFVRL